MTNSKMTKRALLTSIMALMLCFAMLTGTTFAWFTDQETSANNKIIAGNLDVDFLMYYDGSYQSIKDINKPIFGAGSIAQNDNMETLWEPGKTQVAFLAIENAGNLALKYNILVNVVDGGLIGALEYAILDGVTADVNLSTLDWATIKSQYPLAIGDVKEGLTVAAENGTLDEVAKTGFDANNTEKDYFALAVHMKEDAGNEYMSFENDIKSITIDVTVTATQVMAEDDSFDNTYDQDAYLPIVYTAEELAEALSNGDSVTLGANMSVASPVEIPEGVEVTIDLNGYDLSTSDAQNTYILNNHGTLTLMDSGANNAGANSRAISARGIYNGYSADGNHVTTAKLTILGGTYNAMGTNGGAAIYNYGEVVIEGGTFKSNGGYGLNNQSTGKMTISNAEITGGIYNLGELTINSGSVYQHLSGRHAVYNWTGKVVINGGAFDSESGNELILADGTNASVVINNGTFDKTAKSWLFGAATGKNITFEIKGGTFNGYVNKPENTVDTVRPNGDDFDISGGVFNFDPTSWVIDGHVVTNNNNGTWTVDRDYTTVSAPSTDKAENGQALANAIASGAAFIKLGKGEYKMPSISGDKEVTIVGTTDTVVDLTLGAYLENSNVAFEGVTIKGSTGMANGNGSDYAALYTPNVTYTNCTFDGPFRIGRDGATFINCTFKNLGNDYVWTYGNDVTFKGCTFNTDGKAILVYNDGGTEVAEVVVEDCVFNATKGAKAGAIANQNCAAIEIENYGHGVDLTTSGNTFDSNFSGEWRIKAYHEGRTDIIVNGVEYTSIAIDGKAMTIDANNNVTIID